MLTASNSVLNSHKWPTDEVLHISLLNLWPTHCPVPIFPSAVQLDTPNKLKLSAWESQSAGFPLL